MPPPGSRRAREEEQLGFIGGHVVPGVVLAALANRHDRDQGHAERGETDIGARPATAGDTGLALRDRGRRRQRERAGCERSAGDQRDEASMHDAIMGRYGAGGTPGATTDGGLPDQQRVITGSGTKGAVVVGVDGVTLSASHGRPDSRRPWPSGGRWRQIFGTAPAGAAPATAPGWRRARATAR
jgi:hypothetical protein